MLGGGKPGEFGKMLAQHVGGALGLGNAQADAGCRKARAGAVEFAVDAFFDALGDGGLHFVGVGLGFLKAGQALFPFGEFGIAQGGVLDDLVALVFVLEGGDGGVGFGGAHEVAQAKD